jgi:hypothetical protein
MPRLRFSEVFTPNGYPKHTYVQRDEAHHERLLRAWTETSNQIASVSGPSKAGKTVLVQRVVGLDNLITVSGASVRTPDQLWERVLDWAGEPHSTTASVADLASEADARDRTVQVGISGTGASHKSGHLHTEGSTETMAATVNRRGLPQVVADLADSPTTVLIDDFHYIPAAIQSEVAQQLKDAASRGVRICVASVPHRADNVVRALPELRGRVLAVDIDYWAKRELLEIPRIGCELLGIHVDQVSLATFATEAAGSPQLMQSICGWICRESKIEETVSPSRAITLSDAQRKRILFLTCTTVDYRTFVRSLVTGPKARPGERKTYIHSDQRKGDVYLTIMRAIAADPPKLAIPYADLQDRLKQVTKDEPPDGASVIGTLNKVSQIAQQNMPPTGPALEWDEQEQVIVVTDPYLLYYLRWSTFLEKEAEAEA